LSSVTKTPVHGYCGATYRNEPQSISTEKYCGIEKKIIQTFLHRDKM